MDLNNSGELVSTSAFGTLGILTVTYGDSSSIDNGHLLEDWRPSGLSFAPSKRLVTPLAVCPTLCRPHPLILASYLPSKRLGATFYWLEDRWAWTEFNWHSSDGGSDSYCRSEQVIR